MQMVVVPPPPHLSGAIALWALKGRAEKPYAGLPKPFAELVVSLSGTHIWWPFDGAAPIPYREGWLTPIQSGPRFAATQGEIHLIGARLDPEVAARMFGPPPAGAIAAPVPLDLVLGPEAARLRERLMEAPSDPARLALLGDWLSRKMAGVAPSWLPPSRHLRAGGWRVDVLAGQLGLSPRGLRKRFIEQIGVGPKLWLQLGRFDAAIRMAPARGTLANLAVDLGYADQAHMSAEFTRFAGTSPARYGVERSGSAAPAAAPHFRPGA